MSLARRGDFLTVERPQDIRTVGKPSTDKPSTDLRLGRGRKVLNGGGRRQTKVLQGGFDAEQKEELKSIGREALGDARDLAVKHGKEALETGKEVGRHMAQASKERLGRELAQGIPRTKEEMLSRGKSVAKDLFQEAKPHVTAALKKHGKNFLRDAVGVMKNKGVTIARSLSRGIGRLFSRKFGRGMSGGAIGKKHEKMAFKRMLRACLDGPDDVLTSRVLDNPMWLKMYCQSGEGRRKAPKKAVKTALAMHGLMPYAMGDYAQSGGNFLDVLKGIGETVGKVATTVLPLLAAAGTGGKGFPIMPGGQSHSFGTVHNKKDQNGTVQKKRKKVGDDQIEKNWAMEQRRKLANKALTQLDTFQMPRQRNLMVRVAQGDVMPSTVAVPTSRSVGSGLTRYGNPIHQGQTRMGQRDTLFVGQGAKKGRPPTQRDTLLIGSNIDYVGKKKKLGRGFARLPGAIVDEPPPQVDTVHMSAAGRGFAVLPSGRGYGRRGRPRKTMTQRSKTKKSARLTLTPFSY